MIFIVSFNLFCSDAIDEASSSVIVPVVRFVVVTGSSIQFVFQEVTDRFVDYAGRVIVLTVLRDTMMAVSRIRRDSLLPSESRVLNPSVYISKYFFWGLFVHYVFEGVTGF